MPDVIMPQMGESIVEGTVTKWFKKVGDRVERDEPLFEISTDKVDTEIPAPEAGVLTEILVEEGKTVQVNTVVARIGDSAAAAAPAAPPKAAAPPAPAAKPGPAPAPAPKPAPQAAPAAPPAPKAAPASPPTPKPSASPAPASPPEAEAASEAEAAPEPAPASPPASPPSAAPTADADELRSSPLVRRLAQEHNIDLRLVKGSGQGGRISKKDIEDYLASPGAAPSPSAAPEAAPAAAPAPGGAPLPLTPFPPAPAALFGRYEIEKLSVMRQRIGEHMVLTKRVAPHVSTVHLLDCTLIARLRDRVKGQFEAQNGVKLTFLPFFLRAACAALKAFPNVNASLDGTNIVRHREINIGIAVALEGGLLVPVIKNADERNFLGLQKAVGDLAERARHKQLKPDEVQGGTFSISNYGSFGSLFATPAINQPQSAILGLGAIHKAPLVIDDAIAIRSVAYVTLSFDHRLLDGAVADQFMTELKRVIEAWGEEIL